MELNSEIFEAIKAEFAAPGLEPSVQLYRFNQRGMGRYYFRLLDNTVAFYRSATTITAGALPTSPFLSEWYKDVGRAADTVLAETSAYGSLMHRCAGTFLLNGAISEKVVVEHLEYFQSRNADNIQTGGWAERLYEDLMAFSQFCYDCELEPLGIELLLKSEQHSFAGAIDLAAMITVNVNDKPVAHYQSGVNEGQPLPEEKKRRVKATIDLKSSRKNYPDLKKQVQLGLYQMLMVENFGEEWKECIIGNWQPKEWTGKKATYSWTSYEAQETRELTLCAIEMADLLVDKKPGPKMYFGNAPLVLGQAPSGITKLEAEEFLMKQIQKYERK